ncbi:MAG: hypothetical protein Unbinned4234contig1002_37 [Prokaryotic dsDNA virus sp.]|jgi:hypothetical protein|nr:MAG: hypothetical protein Unbinned4234contig1002_37 [Prokaryotic dsDNA virus sp.]|tara:strand:- start:1633 stop:1881 length:249 start_codon:yes stop_codon:yes gene_type:complete
MSKSEKGIELTNQSWARTLLWFDIEVLIQEGSYEPENHYKALIKGKPLHEYRDMQPDELIAIRDWLTTQVMKEQIKGDGPKI